MKKRILLAAALLALSCTLTACGHRHEWQEAGCEAPKTCAVCGETEGEALGHTWQGADCVNPKTCSVCGKTEGEALGHTWQGATCEEPALCTVCGETGRAPLGHIIRATPVEDAETGKISCIGLCHVCGQENCSMEYDSWEALAFHWVVGEWQFSKCMTVKTFDTFVPDTMVGDGFVFREDGTAEFIFEGEKHEGTWAYLTTAGQVTTVWCLFESPDGTMCQFCYSPTVEIGWYTSDHTVVVRYEKVPAVF